MTERNEVTLPEGHNTINPFIISENIPEQIKFITEVFGGVQDENALTYDDDGTIFHSEVRVGNSTIMLAERKPEWRFTPAFLQVYVSDVEATLQRAAERGAQVITKPTEFIGVKFSRIQDPFRNIWWVYEPSGSTDWEASFEGAEEGSWTPTEEATYIHDSVIEAMNKLAKD